MKSHQSRHSIDVSPTAFAAWGESSKQDLPKKLYYCVACRCYVFASDVIWEEDVEIHDPRKGGCGCIVFDGTEEEFWGMEEANEEERKTT